MDNNQKNLIKDVLGSLNLSYTIKNESYRPRIEIAINDGETQKNDIYFNIPTNLQTFVFQIILDESCLDLEFASEIFNMLSPGLILNNYVANNLELGGSQKAGYFSIYLCDAGIEIEESIIRNIIISRLEFVYRVLIRTNAI